MINTKRTKEDIENEIIEIETNQHPNFYKNERGGRKRMAALLEELNIMEKEAGYSH